MIIDNVLTITTTLATIFIALAVYWLPTIVAVSKKKKDLGAIAVLNVFGFFFIPWLMALVWSCKED